MELIIINISVLIYIILEGRIRLGVIFIYYLVFRVCERVIGLIMFNARRIYATKDVIVFNVALFTSYYSVYITSAEFRQEVLLATPYIIDGLKARLSHHACVSSGFCGMSMIEKTRPLWLRYSRKLHTGTPSARTRQSSFLYRLHRYRDIASGFLKCGISTRNTPLEALYHRWL